MRGPFVSICCTFALLLQKNAHIFVPDLRPHEIFKLICYAKYIYPEVPNSDLASCAFWQYSFKASLSSSTKSSYFVFFLF
ncbi:hypothetical protein ACJX0J_025387, partial [Zea mays]